MLSVTVKISVQSEPVTTVVYFLDTSASERIDYKSQHDCIVQCTVSDVQWRTIPGSVRHHGIMYFRLQQIRPTQLFCIEIGAMLKQRYRRVRLYGCIGGCIAKDALCFHTADTMHVCNVHGSLIEWTQFVAPLNSVNKAVFSGPKILNRHRFGHRHSSLKTAY